jgi:hypothetical protein
MGIIAAKVELLPAIRPLPKAPKVPAMAPPAAPTPAPATPKVAEGTTDAPAPAPAEPPAAGPPPVEEETPPLTPEESRSQEIRDFCMRQLNRCKTDLKSWALQLIHGAILGGHKLGEMVCGYAAVGPDGPSPDDPDGRIVLVDIKPRPRWAYRFVVNNFMDRIGILTQDPADMRWVVLPDSRFVLATWLPRDGDPRGRSQLRAAYTWFHLKRLIPASYYKFIKQHGSPVRFGFTAPDQHGEVPPIDTKTGAELANKPRVSPQARLKQVLEWLEGGSVAAFPAGTIIRTDWPQGKGDPFLAAIELCDRQMALALFHATRVTMESKFGSKADSSTAQDEKGLLIHYGRSIFRTLVVQALRPLIEANFSAEDAEIHMPEVCVEKDEHQDRASMWTAAAAIFPFLSRSQLAPFFAMLGIPLGAEDDEPMGYGKAGASPAQNSTVPIGPDGQLTPDARVGRDAA